MARRDAYEAKHARNRILYEKKIKAIYEEVCRECGYSSAQLESIVKNAGESAVFARIPAVRKVLDKLQRKLSERLKTTVVDGVRAEWKLANDKYDALVGTMVAGDLLAQMDEGRRARTFARNLEALDAFLKRKEGGLDLSQRVWNYSGQMREAMEAALQLGISEGESAAEIARDLKQYLVYPDKLFRRVRDKETGELKLSEPASMFHPGQGVYRSSYKNALRLALNETNIAYRKADSIRRVGLDFVVGIEIHLSNNHNCKGVPEGEFFDICDILQGKYPPDFEFVGWHPNCRCWTSSILQTEDEFFRDSDGKYRGSVNEVKDVPPQFKRWLAENESRIAQAEERGTLPYFLRDNTKYWQNDDGGIITDKKKNPPAPRVYSIKDSTLDDYERRGLITAAEKVSIKNAKTKQDAQLALQQTASERVMSTLSEYIGKYESRNKAITKLLAEAEARKGLNEVKRIDILNQVKDLCAKECANDLKSWGAIGKGIKFKDLERCVDIMPYGDHYTAKGKKISIPRVTKDIIVFIDKNGYEYAYPIGVDESLIRFKATNASQLMADASKMPKYLSNQLKRLTFMDCDNPWDVYWESEYKTKGFHSLATDGSRTTVWDFIKSDNDFLWTMRHELGHVFDFAHLLSSKGTWRAAARADKRFPTPYGESAFNANGKYEEDFADSIRSFIKNPARFRIYYPNRAALIEKYIKLFPNG